MEVNVKGEVEKMEKDEVIRMAEEEQEQGRRGGYEGEVGRG